jgi:hypothetical protein
MPFPPPIGLRDYVFPLESDITICKTSSTGIGDSSSPSFLDVEFSSDEDILEAVILYFRPTPELKALLVGF